MNPLPLPILSNIALSISVAMRPVSRTGGRARILLRARSNHGRGGEPGALEEGGELATPDVTRTHRHHGEVGELLDAREPGRAHRDHVLGSERAGAVAECDQ